LISSIATYIEGRLVLRELSLRCVRVTWYGTTSAICTRGTRTIAEMCFLRSLSSRRGQTKFAKKFGAHASLLENTPLTFHGQLSCRRTTWTFSPVGFVTRTGVPILRTQTSTWKLRWRWLDPLDSVQWGFSMPIHLLTGQNRYLLRRVLCIYAATRAFPWVASSSDSTAMRVRTAREEVSKTCDALGPAQSSGTPIHQASKRVAIRLVRRPRFGLSTLWGRVRGSTPTA
jgi:hypothetical protein